MYILLCTLFFSVFSPNYFCFSGMIFTFQIFCTMDILIYIDLDVKFVFLNIFLEYSWDKEWQWRTGQEFRIILINRNPCQEWSYPSGMLWVKFILPYGLVMDYMTFQSLLQPDFMILRSIHFGIWQLLHIDYRLF